MSGRKRHLLVDTTGLILRVVVHPANVQDRDGGRLVLDELVGRCPRPRHLWADVADQGGFVDWVTQTLGWTVLIVRKRRR